MSAKPFLEGQIAAKGYPSADVFGPFDGPDGRVEYAVTVAAGEAPPLTARGTFDELRARVDALPRAQPPGRGRRRKPAPPG